MLDQGLVAIKKHLLEGFGYAETRLEEMTKEELVKAFDAEMSELAIYYKKIYYKKEEDFNEKYTCDVLIKSVSFRDLQTVIGYSNDPLKRKYLWTVVDTDEGICIFAGYHFVNRIHYIITKEPWEYEDESYLIEEHSSLN